ncbi:MAG: DUF2147 domain-containing protein [Halioglobus sp.]
MIRIILSIAVLLVAQLAAANDISGFWKHADEPGWIEIRLDDGKGTVVRNDKFPERAGREILKGLAADDAEAETWRGQIYVEKLGEYKDAEITLADPERMKIKVKVGFMSRTLEWQRVEEVPAAP